MRVFAGAQVRAAIPDHVLEPGYSTATGPSRIHPSGSLPHEGTFR